jgi:hypothetical protein
MRTLLAVACSVALAALSGCGGETAGGTGSTAAPRTSLTIEIYPQGPGGSLATYELQCDPTGGSLPDPPAACDEIGKLDADAFAPVPEDTMCSQQFGGPQLAKVTGRLGGETIGAQFARTDGCQIARWDRLAFLFPRDDGT